MMSTENITAPYEVTFLLSDWIEEFLIVADIHHSQGRLSEAKKWEALAEETRLFMLEYLSSNAASHKENLTKNKNKQGEENAIICKN